MDSSEERELGLLKVQFYLMTKAEENKQRNIPLVSGDISTLWEHRIFSNLVNELKLGETKYFFN